MLTGDCQPNASIVIQLHVLKVQCARLENIINIKQSDSKRVHFDSILKS